jgi:polyhydroxyalkanoate synthase
MATTATKQSKARATGGRTAARAALDVMLTDAVVERGGARRFVQPTAAAKAVAGLARRPDRVARRAGELARVAAGQSERAPAKGDRRFADRAWQQNWLLHRILQGYLAITETVDELISDAQLDWRAERQARFAAGNVLDALAPTNFPWSNPTVIKEIVDQGGANLVKGARRFVRDVSRSPRLPATVDTSKFDVGVNLALTPARWCCTPTCSSSSSTSRRPSRCATCRCCSSRRRSTSTTCWISLPRAAWSSTWWPRASRCS